MKNMLKWLIPVGLSVMFYALPITGLNEAGHRIGAVFILASLLWILESIPIYATSMVIMAMLSLLATNQTFSIFQLDESYKGALLSYADIYGTFASPVIMLFLGGLFLARAASLYKVDQNLARVFFSLTGRNATMVLMGVMGITACFSMFMSNTATTAMMLTLILPVVSSLPGDDGLKKALVISVPVAANIGGIGTPIGTPPNAVALAALEKTGETISFLKWMLLGVPYVVILLICALFLIKAVFKSETKEIEIQLNGSFLKTAKAWVVYITGIVTITGWLTSGLHPFSSSVVAFIPVLIFSMTAIVDARELQKMNWDILWLIAGGLSLGIAMEKSGFNQWMVMQIPFESIHPLGIILCMALLGVALSTFISNTATANLLIPVAISLSFLLPENKLLLPVALSFSCSVAMALPISTPPNALAFATGEIESGDLLKIGGVVSLTGVALLLVFSTLWKSMGL